MDNGIPYSNEPLMQHYLRAPLSLDGPIDVYEDMKNVQLVKKIFPPSQWPIAFPYANDIY